MFGLTYFPLGDGITPCSTMIQRTVGAGFNMFQSIDPRNYKNRSEVARRKCGFSLYFWEVAVVLLKPDLAFKFGPANILDTVLLQVTCKLQICLNFNGYSFPLSIVVKSIYLCFCRKSRESSNHLAKHVSRFTGRPLPFPAVSVETLGFRRLDHGTNSSWMCVCVCVCVVPKQQCHVLKQDQDIIKGIMDEHTMSNVEILREMSKKKTTNLLSFVSTEMQAPKKKSNQYQILWECCQAQMNFYGTSQVKTPMIRSFRCCLLTPPCSIGQGAPDWRRQTSGDINDTKNREGFRMDLFLK